MPVRGNTRRAIVLLSDGVDNISRLGVSRAVDLARRTDVPVYSLGLLDRVERRRRDVGADILRRFSRETGGEAFFTENYYQVHRAIRQVVEDLKQAYVLGYYPSRSGEALTLEVEASCRGCRVTTRRGLYAKPAR